VWIDTGNKRAKFRGNTLSLSENIAKSFRGATFLTHTVDAISRLITPDVGRPSNAVFSKMCVLHLFTNTLKRGAQF